MLNETFLDFQTPCVFRSFFLFIWDTRKDKCFDTRALLATINQLELPLILVSNRDVTSRGSNSNSTRSSNLYYCSIKARSSIFLFEPKLELARTRKKSSKVQPKYRCQSITLAFSKKYLTLGKKNFHTWLKSFLSNGLLPDFFGFFAGKH